MDKIPSTGSMSSQPLTDSLLPEKQHNSDKPATYKKKQIPVSHGTEPLRQSAIDKTTRVTLPPSRALQYTRQLHNELSVLVEMPDSLARQQQQVQTHVETIRLIDQKWAELILSFAQVQNRDQGWQDEDINPPRLGPERYIGVERSINQLMMTLREIQSTLTDDAPSQDQTSQLWQKAAVQSHKLGRHMAFAEQSMNKARLSLNTPVTPELLRQTSEELDIEKSSILYKGGIKTLKAGLKGLKLAVWLSKAPFNLVATLLDGAVWTTEKLFDNVTTALAIPHWIANKLLSVGSEMSDTASDLYEDVRDTIGQENKVGFRADHYRPLTHDMATHKTARQTEGSIKNSLEETDEITVDTLAHYNFISSSPVFTANHIKCFMPPTQAALFPDPVSANKLLDTHNFHLLYQLHQHFPETFSEYPNCLPDLIAHLQEHEDWQDEQHLNNEKQPLIQLIKDLCPHAAPETIEQAMLNTIMIRTKNPYSHTANAILQTFEQAIGYSFASKPENRHLLAEALSGSLDNPMDITLIWIRHVPQPDQFNLLTQYPRLLPHIIKAFRHWERDQELTILENIQNQQKQQHSYNQAFPPLMDDQDEE